MKAKIFDIVIIIGCIVCITIFLWPPSNIDNSIPSIPEFQQMLVDNGYDIKVDGKLGKETESAWIDMWFKQRVDRDVKN